MPKKTVQGVLALALVLVTTGASAQPMSRTAAVPAPGAAMPIAQVLKVPEGTEVRLRTDEVLTSKTAAVGDRFSLTLDEPIDLGGGVTIPAGYKAVGEITNAEPRGHMGKAGKLTIQISYVKIGDKRVHLRASQGAEGKGSLGSTVALTMLFGPLGLLARGADLVIPAGKKITAYVDGDTLLDMPLPAAPASPT